MAVAFIFRAGTLDQAGYDGIMKNLDDRSAGAWTSTAGFIAHLGGADPAGGWQVIDVWESEDAANAFYGSEVFGAVREGTADAGLEMTPWPLHRVEVFGSFSQTT